MQDTFVEVMVPRKTSGKEMIIEYMIFIIAGVTIAAGVFFMPPLIFLGIAIGALGYYLYTSWKLEYEYSFVENELEIDKIMNKSRRKNVYRVNTQEIEKMVPEAVGTFDMISPDCVYDFSSGIAGAKNYVLVVTQNQQREHIIFEPNQEMVDAMTLKMPGKVKGFGEMPKKMV